MQNKKYTKEFQVHYYEINQYQEATSITILKYLEEAAICHSESVGLGIGKLKAEGIGWVLNRWFVNIDEYPVWNEKVIIETWPSKFERFYATREFSISNSRGKAIGRARALWVFLNIEKKRPMRIPAEFGEAYSVDSLSTVEGSFREIESVSDLEFKKEFQVRRSDIDTNDHVNNTKYVEWILEAIPQDVYENFTLSTLEVLYKKEIGYGFNICSLCKSIKLDNSSREYGHSIYSKDNVTELTLARTLWKKR